jgi:hypothetical protein
VYKQTATIILTAEQQEEGTITLVLASTLHRLFNNSNNNTFGLLYRLKWLPQLLSCKFLLVWNSI